MTASTLESSTSVALLFEENLLFTQDAILLAIFFFTRRYLELQVWAKAAWQARDVSGSAEPYCAGFAQRAGLHSVDGFEGERLACGRKMANSFTGAWLSRKTLGRHVGFATKQ